MDWLTSILAAIGGINMALVGFFNYDLLNQLFTSGAAYRSVLAVISVAVLYLVGDVWVRVSSFESKHAHA
jgi:uncharacterized membrane protein YuzA (DUF378 family)